VFGLGKSKAVVGLDIGSSAVKAVELKQSGKKTALLSICAAGGQSGALLMRRAG